MNKTKCMMVAVPHSNEYQDPTNATMNSDSINSDSTHLVDATHLDHAKDVNEKVKDLRLKLDRCRYQRLYLDGSFASHRDRVQKLDAEIETIKKELKSLRNLAFQV